jgi:hypothetical protein
MKITGKELLLLELNNLYVNLTGEGLSEHYIQVLSEGGSELIQAVIDEQYEFIEESLSFEMNIDVDTFFAEQEEVERCDSIEYYNDDELYIHY